VSCKQFDDSDATGVVWREVLWGVFSTLGRLRAVANCRGPDSGRYDHESVRCVLGDKDSDHALRAVHELLWSEWIGGSLEQQQADLFLYIRDLGEDGGAILAEQSDWRPFRAFIPDSAGEEEQALFTSNLSVLFALSRNPYGWQRRRIFPKEQNARMEQMLQILRDEYAGPRLTLRKLAVKMRTSERHLGRLFKRYTDQSFHSYLREFRIDEAVTRGRFFVVPLAIKLTHSHTTESHTGDGRAL
jgi:hypothetical protein